ncbi:hypothetical protein BSLG_003505 [Batrachochytrium salamandrivorans]|nr:hypothetical protein BSLG_003505 [Batrachochytrium salamandrivorans]
MIDFPLFVIYKAGKLLVGALDLPMTPEEYIAERKMGHLAKFPFCKPLPGVLRLVSHLKKHNIPIVASIDLTSDVATSSFRDAFDLKAKNNQDLFSLFDGNVVCGDDPHIKKGKPAPDIFLAAAQAIGNTLQAPRTCLVFEDSPAGVLAGLNAEMQVAWIPDVNMAVDGACVLDPEFRPSADGVNGNLLILLHGLGDTAENFVKFGVKMQLPQTALCAITGPSPIPFFESGTGWYPAFNRMDGTGMMIYDQILTTPILTPPDLALDSSEVRNGIKATRLLIYEFLTECVIASASHHPDGWPSERVFLFGFSQGGVMALDAALMGHQVSLKLERPVGKQDSPLKLGGVISISGWINPDMYDDEKASTRGVPLLASYTSVLVTQGERDEGFDLAELSSKKSTMRRYVVNDDQLEVSLVAGKGHSMPQSQEEMRIIIAFLANRLWLRNLALEAMSDVVEITTQQ